MVVELKGEQRSRERLRAPRGRAWGTGERDRARDSEAQTGEGGDPGNQHVVGLAQVTPSPGHFLAAGWAPPLGAAGAGRAPESDAADRRHPAPREFRRRKELKRATGLQPSCCFIHAGHAAGGEGLVWAWLREKQTTVPRVLGRA